MITIVKDNNKKTVTKGAYKSFYECLGYQPINNKAKKEVDNHTDKKSNKSKDTNE